LRALNRGGGLDLAVYLAKETTESSEGAERYWFENTPKAFANSSPGLERKRQPWDQISIFVLNPVKGFLTRRTMSHDGNEQVRKRGLPPLLRELGSAAVELVVAL